jgi:pimeloyl-ACP methyl ester carboxylesterase
VGSAAALALANHLLARRAEVRHPPRGAFVTVSGARLHYLEAGEGPTVVLLHGNGVSADDFLASGLLGRLARTRRVIAFDRPGFGHSQRPRGKAWNAARQAEAIAEALRLLDVTRPLVVAHSWGTLVAVELALRDPEALAGLVLMSGYYRPTFRPGSILAAAPAAPVVGDLVRHTLSPVIGRLAAPLILKQLFAPAGGSQRFRRLYPVALSLRPSQLRTTAAEAGLMGPDAARLAPRLPQLKTPTLVIAGRGDRLVDPQHQSAWLARQLPDAGLFTIEGAGHMVHHSALDDVAAGIEIFSPLPAPLADMDDAGGRPAPSHGAPGVPPRDETSVASDAMSGAPHA